jgi:CRP-like cAMP-binding protein
MPHLELISLQEGQVVYEPGVPVHDFYFPVDAVVSLYVMLGDGYTAESASVDKYSMFPLSLLAGGYSLNRAVVRLPGFVYRIPAAVLCEEFRRGEALMQVLLEAIKWMVAKITLSSVCSRHHSIDQQVAQWLLVSMDSTKSHTIAATHDHIARNLGFRREGVTHTLGKFLSRFVISSVRGRIEVLNRPALEAIVCSCYRDHRLHEQQSQLHALYE